MAEYDGNGDNYNSYETSSDFKRKNSTKSDEIDDNDEESGPAAEKATEYIRDLLGEKVTIARTIDHKFPNADRLIDQGMN